MVAKNATDSLALPIDVQGGNKKFGAKGGREEASGFAQHGERRRTFLQNCETILSLSMGVKILRMTISDRQMKL